MSFLKRLLNFNQKTEPTSASLAKERLTILISHEKERSQNNAPDFLPALKKEILDVISKYINIDPDDIQIAMDCVGDKRSMELNFTIPETTAKPKATATEKKPSRGKKVEDISS